MGRAPCCDKDNVKRGPWSPEEDAKLKGFIDKNGTGGNWIALPHKAGLKRCGKSCRLRWLNYLRPNIKHGEFSDDEDRIICGLYANIGSRWSIIAAQLPGRTDNDIKNYWNTKLKKKIMAMLPSFQKKSSFFPNIPLQTPQSYKSNHFLNNNSTPFYGLTNPNFMNLNNNINTLLNNTTLVQDHMSLISPSLQDSNSLINLITNNNIINNGNGNSIYLGFQEDHNNMYNNTQMGYNYHTSDVKEAMLMFGNGGHEVSTTGSSSECGSCLTQISYGNCTKDKQQIKQEDQFLIQGYGDEISHSFMMNNLQMSYNEQQPKSYERSLHSDVEEVKQLTGNTNSSSISSYLFNDDDEYKTTHDDGDHKEICYNY
ncbi:uncharacterized protein [Rutidosis leptorrhynchoides]|uniref:uncharacterized protein n=1 Tax=Rutidosis leptorrhynchoides TaxID=125765 RepID=UPI003A99EA74